MQFARAENIKIYFMITTPTLSYENPKPSNSEKKINEKIMKKKKSKEAEWVKMDKKYSIFAHSTFYEKLNETLILNNNYS